MVYDDLLLDYINLYNLKRFTVLQRNKQTAFVRDSTAYKTDGAIVGINQPRIEIIGYKKGILIEEGTTNLNSDPFFETGISGWNKREWTTLEWLSSEYNPFSKKNGVMRLYDNNGIGFCSKVVFISNTPHTVSVLLKILKGNINNINVGGTVFYTDNTYTDYTWSNSNTTRYDMSAVFGQGVYKLVATITPDNSKTISSYELRISHTDTIETELLVYAVQLEAKPYATSFVNGTRSSETLTIPTVGILSPQEGTVECWVYVNDVLKRADGIPRRIWHIGREDDDNMQGLILYCSNLYWTVLYTQKIDIMDSTINIGWHYFAVTWGNFGVRLYIDGVKKGENSAVLAGNFSPVFRLGHRGDYSRYADTLFADVRISSRARTDEEIAEAYAKGILSYDASTTFLLDTKLAGWE